MRRGAADLESLWSAFEKANALSPKRNDFEPAEASRSAFLESPTGTGKTLAALAAALAWQRANYETTPTRVVWVARTHDQLQHAVREYERSCPYRPLMSLRLSRERFCLHPDIATAPNKAEACEEATKIKGNNNKKGRFDVKHSGCGHLDTAERIGYPQSKRWRPHFRLGGAMNVRDIEEAVKEGQATHVCPFHMAQDQIQEGAALIFVTYQQLVEPITRRAGGLEQVFEDAVVVVDEAHNLPQVAREVDGPDGIEVTYNFEAAKDATAGYAARATLVNGVASY